MVNTITHKSFLKNNYYKKTYQLHVSVASFVLLNFQFIMYTKLKYVFILCLFIATSCGKEELVLSLEDQSTSSEMLNEIENKILQQVNDYRTSIGKEPLIINLEATKLAKEHTSYMVSNNKISHDYFQDRFDELVQNANASIVRENVASHYNTAEDVMNAWLSSAEHKSNITGNFTHIGIAAIEDTEGQYYYTQIFFKQ